MNVSQLVSQVRNQLDELNEASVDDKRDIIPSLNRGHDYACSLLARLYEPLLLTNTIVVTDSSLEYPIPLDAFENRIEHIEMEYDVGYWRHLTSIDFRESSLLEGFGISNYPTHFSVVGNSIRVLPPTGNGTNLRIWYSKDPGQLVLEQGQIRVTPELNQTYLILNEVGDELSEDSSSLKSFFNVVDGNTGAIKGTFQIDYVENSRIYISTNPVYDTVGIRKVSTSLEDLNIKSGDWVCSYEGTCIPVLKKPLSNFLVQFAVAEITRKLGGDAPTEEAVLRKFEEQVKKTWAGRSKTLKVSRNNPNWGTSSRRPSSSKRY